MKLYNDEVKVLNDLKYRYAHIHCHGSYGVNPAVTMLTRESTMRNAFIKDFEFERADGELSETYLIVDSEYGKEVKVPMSKVIGMDILSSKEQAFLEIYLRDKERWEDEITRYNEMLNDDGLDGESLKVVERMVEVTKHALKRGEKLVEKGVKTFK